MSIAPAAIRPRVSVITVVYNGGRLLEETIRSVLDQSYGNVEYIIVDGGSTDETLDVIRSWEHRIAKWVSEKDDGIYDAMNKGIGFATGELVGILNCGDRYLPDTIERVVRAASGRWRDRIITGHMRRFSRTSEVSFVNRRHPDGLKKAHVSMPINHPSTFVGIDVYRAIGAFDLRYRIVADSEFVLRAIRNDVPIVYVDEILSEMELGGVSERWSSLVRRANEHFQIRARYGYPVIGNAGLYLGYLVRSASKAFLKSVLGEGTLRHYYARKR